MGIETTRVGRQRSILQPRISLLFGCTLGTAAAVGGCGDEASLPLGVGAAAAVAGSGAGVAGSFGGSATAGNATAGSGTSGSATSAGSGGTAPGTAGNATNAGSGGSAGGSGGNGGSGASGGNAGSAGSASSGGAAGSAGSAGSGGSAGADACPDDADKTQPGVCGCGVAETDTDGDTTPDCTDLCPDDAAKTMVGVCGCGLSDTANADGDAAVDCKDACPNNAALTVAGTCGCLPDALGALCLAHRYQFEGTGTVATDSIAGASGNGTVVGATLSGTGTLVLAGGTSDQYVKLPAGLISALGNSATIEAWVTWAGTGGDWQRIFDFGSSTGGQDMQGDGQGYLFLTPRATGTALRVAISAAGGGDEDLVSSTTALPSATLSHVAVVIDGAAKTLALYRNGASDGTAATIRDTTTLSSLKDLNNWLGRSQYQSDEELAGTYHEVRIYSRSLSAAQIGASFTAGPDTLP